MGFNILNYLRLETSLIVNESEAKKNKLNNKIHSECGLYLTTVAQWIVNVCKVLILIFKERFNLFFRENDLTPPFQHKTGYVNSGRESKSGVGVCSTWSKSTFKVINKHSYSRTKKTHMASNVLDTAKTNQ